MWRALDPEAVTRVTDAVRGLEKCSCAEVVVEIRARSGSYAHADARFAAAASFLALLGLLFSHWEFRPWAVVADALIVFAIAYFASRRSDSVRRVMTTERERLAQVRITAGSVFYERGIANTTAETGVLVYLSLLERRIELLADRGILESVPSMGWNRLVAEAQSHEATVATAVEVIHALTPLLSQHLPLRDGDRDELSNAPRFVND